MERGAAIDDEPVEGGGQGADALEDRIAALHVVARGRAALLQLGAERRHETIVAGNVDGFVAAAAVSIERRPAERRRAEIVQHRDLPAVGRVEMRQALQQLELLRRRRDDGKIALHARQIDVREAEHLPHRLLEATDEHAQIRRRQRRTDAGIKVSANRREAAPRGGNIDERLRFRQEIIDHDGGFAFTAAMLDANGQVRVGTKVGTARRGHGEFVSMRVELRSRRRRYKSHGAPAEDIGRTSARVSSVEDPI